MTRPKLIVLNGFPASGKTTIAKKYIAEHSMALSIEADAMVDNIGDWSNHKEEVRQLTFELTKSMAQTYLPSGHDVVLPYFVTTIEEAEEFESIAIACGADYHEFVLYNERADAIVRLLKRGKWGGASSPSLSDKDMPEIEELMNKMESALQLRPHAVKIWLKDQDPNTTYSQLIQKVYS
jgi:predicted kinase